LEGVEEDTGGPPAEHNFGECVVGLRADLCRGKLHLL